jgi:hypothetical protein
MFEADERLVAFPHATDLTSAAEDPRLNDDVPDVRRPPDGEVECVGRIDPRLAPHTTRADLTWAPIEKGEGALLYESNVLRSVVPTIHE